MAEICSDTNVLRYFGTAFAQAELPNDLREHLLLVPLSVIELLSQLGTSGAEGAFTAIQAFPKIYNTKASGMLPRYVSRIIPLAFLVPDLTEAILEGNQAADLSLDACLGNIQDDWNQQRANIARL